MEEWVRNSLPKFTSALTLLEAGTTPVSSDENSKELSIYKNQYDAEEIIDQLLIELERLEANGEEQFSFKKTVLTSLLNYYQGIISIETEELSSGETFLLKALQSLEGYASKPECCVLAVNIRNQLGILWSERGEHAKACEYLKSATTIYNNYKSSNESPPIPLKEVFTYINSSQCTYNDIDSGFGKSHVYTLYYLAQVYKHLGNSEEAAIHCHMTLKWQIENQEYELFEWALNCASLSQFFLVRENFTVARYLLGCASYMLTKSDPADHDQDQCKLTKADVSRCWAAFGLSLLESSQKLLSADNSELTENKEETQLAKSFADVCKMEEYALIKEDFEMFENKMPCLYVQNYEQAKTVFLATLSCLTEAKEYYKFDDYASAYVAIVQDTSKLYKLLTFFESDRERQCKMHKRRADQLEEILKSLNMQYWLSVIRQLHFELGELYSEMMDLKYMNTEGEKVSGHAATKINSLILKSTKHFFLFIDTFRNADKLPERYDDDYVRPALLAHFYIARHYNKIVFTDVQNCMENLKLSKEFYDYISDYILKNPDQEACIQEELKLVREMQQLLPEKMRRIFSSCLH